jgi:hypothetical protein
MPRAKTPAKFNPFAGPLWDSCTITISAEASHVITVTLQFKDANGNNLTAPAVIDAHISGASTGLTNPSAVATWAATTGLLIQAITGKLFKIVTDATGKAILTSTYNGADTTYLTLHKLNGALQVSGALAHA